MSAAEIVTLKVNGKAYACKNGPSKKRCNSKEFVLDPLAKEITYACAACGWFMTSSPGFNVEAQLPPHNGWMTPGGSVMAPEPGKLWTTLHEEYGFNVDLAADANNRKTLLYLDEDYDALVHDWYGADLLARAEALNVLVPMTNGIVLPSNIRVFANPPYQPRGVIETWLTKAVEQCERGVFSAWLIPMASSVGWFNDLVIPYAQWTTFEGRIAFIDPLASADDARMSPKQDNLFVVYDPNAVDVGHVAHRNAKTGEVLWRRS